MKRLLLLSVCLAWALSVAPQTTVFVIGDSTAATKELSKQNPERGWGQMLQPFFDSAVKVENHARNGRSTKSFVTLGHWAEVESRMKAGDFLLIQFGHNDSKASDTVRFSTPEQYGRNLRGFIDAARRKGAVPVLLSPVVRRWWKEGVLADSHGEYLRECQRVAEEENVIFIDAERLTRQMVEEAGEEGSARYFMNIPEGISPLYPDGRTDNTHFTVCGARKTAELICRQLEEQIPTLAPHIRYWDWVVAKDGSGDFFTITEAIAATPDFAKTEWTKIYIRNGLYREKLNIPSTKRLLQLTGENVNSVIVDFDDYASKVGPTGHPMGTSGSATVYAMASDFMAEHMTFRNSAGEVGQAVALLSGGDRQTYRDCRFEGNQDTLYLYGLGNRDGEKHADNTRLRFEECYVEGTTDFIFGSAEAYFKGCTIMSKRNSYITAASTCRGQKYGFVFDGCTLTAAEGIDSCYLGRPWRPYAKTVFINCSLGAHIRPEGWHDWDKPQVRRGSAFYAEYGNSGEGADLSHRVRWSKKPSAGEAIKLLRAMNVNE